MAEPYTPNTEQVRDAYVRAMRDAFIASASEHRDEFNRWHEADSAESWDDGYASGLREGLTHDGPEMNPHRLERRKVRPDYSALYRELETREQSERKFTVLTLVLLGIALTGTVTLIAISVARLVGQ